ncbi:MAG: metallophosphoesterase [Candidatus Neomarinimicrobiota bacterium]
MKSSKCSPFLIAIFIVLTAVSAQNPNIPKSYASLAFDAPDSLVYISPDGQRIPATPHSDGYRLSSLRSIPVANDSAVVFDFQAADLDGWLYYGLIQTEGIKYHYPVFFHRRTKISGGKTTVKIKENLGGLFDISGWEKSGLLRLGYRVVTSSGDILYDGKIIISGTGPFRVEPSIIEGPFVNLLTPDGATISFVTSTSLQAEITVGRRVFRDEQVASSHEIAISGLKADQDYEYIVRYGDLTDSYSFHTAPQPGSRKPFTFAYASDGRGNAGGGERDIKGTNAYIMKRIAVTSALKNARFFQFTGDFIDGCKTDTESLNLEYANWKRAIEPFAHYLPFVPGMGNHESLWIWFSSGGKRIILDSFPFAEHSTEALFARNFVNPLNGPQSEDGAVYDPDPETTDFPTYQENVYYYTYDNIAMVVLSSDYWYAPTIRHSPETGGNLHGYLLDNQLRWLRETLAKLEQDQNIDHVFVTHHAPIFPNGGHVSNAMWWNGDNSMRPTIAGQAVAKGIIENRDEYLDILMNSSTKVLAVLTSDEHNYHRMLVTAKTPIYPENYELPRLTRFRPLHQINNGAAGAPYYGQEKTPWSSAVDKFSSQFAVVFFHVDGRAVRVEVLNPDTMELIDSFHLAK